MTTCVVGVDVGTGSARAGVFDLNGTQLALAAEPITMWKPRPDYAEQSSDDIWRAVAKSIRASIAQAGVSVDDALGLSFDATCSLVVLDRQDRPITVDPDGDNERNVIVWMDHRALAETERINAGGYDVLKFVGGKLSPEMETPKLLWLKTHLPRSWASAGKFLDLADFLTYRATGVDARSLCTTVCKWTYLGHEKRWDHDFFRNVGLEDLFERDKVVEDVRAMGTFLGHLTPASAAELGLTTKCAVGVGIIDAHAGGLGLLGSVWERGAPRDRSMLETALALIGGTSNCLMAVSPEPRYIHGIWGPYFGAMVPDMWLTEGGQTTAGSAIDWMITNHANAPVLDAQARTEGRTAYEILNATIRELQAAADLASPARLTRNIHILPYFLGNRSPNADAHARATIDGLSLDQSLTSQALLYYAAIQAVAYGTRDVARAMNEAGYRIETLFVTGGGTKNPLWLQEHADATGLTLILPKEPEAVLLGSAILAAVASGAYPSVPAAMQAMSGRGETVRPNPATEAYHAAKFEVFRELYAQQVSRRAAMAGF